MSSPSKYRYPAPPQDATPEEKSVWNTMTRILEQRDRDFSFGNPKSIQVNQLKDGVLMKSFTTVTTSVTNYYMQSDDGTLLVSSSLSGCTVWLTSAIDSQYATICVKKVDGNGATMPVIIKDISLASIDGGVAVTVSSTNGSVILSCDGKAWFVLSKNL